MLVKEELVKGILPVGGLLQEPLNLGDIKNILEDSAGKHLLLNIVEMSGAYLPTFHDKSQDFQTLSDQILRLCGYYTLIYEDGVKSDKMDAKKVESLLYESLQNISIIRTWERWAMNPVKWEYVQKYYFSITHGHISSYHFFSALVVQASKIDPFGYSTEVYRLIERNKDKFDRR